MASQKSLITVLSLLVILAISCCQSLESPKSSKQAKKQTEPTYSFSLDPYFTVNTFYDEIKSDDSLRMSSSYVTMEAVSDYFGASGSGGNKKNTVAHFKYSRLEEMIPCRDLDVIQSHEVDSILCQTVDKHTLDASLPAPSPQLSLTTDYVRRSSVRLKGKKSFVTNDTRKDLLLYPLKQQVIENEIQTILKETDVHELKFTKAARLDLGYYFELTLEAKVEQPIVCSGKALISINRTEIFARLSNDRYPEFADELSYLTSQGAKNGFLFSLENVNCAKPSSNLFKFSMDFDFTVIKQLEFPFLTVRNSLSTRPLKQILYYEASLDQDRSTDSHKKHAYNTTINIDGSSYFAPGFNFNLRQVFVNEDKQTGWEEMIFTHRGMPIIIDAVWGVSRFFKSARVFWLDSDKDDFVNARQKIKEAFKLSFENDAKKDHATLTLNIRKDMLPNLSQPSLDGLLDMFTEEGHPGYVYNIPLNSNLVNKKELEHDEL